MVERFEVSWFATRDVPSKPNLYRSVGDAVRAGRKRANLSQEELAEEADLTRNCISQIERAE